MAKVQGGYLQNCNITILIAQNEKQTVPWWSSSFSTPKTCIPCWHLEQSWINATWGTHVQNATSPKNVCPFDKMNCTTLIPTLFCPKYIYKMLNLELRCTNNKQMKNRTELSWIQIWIWIDLEGFAHPAKRKKKKPLRAELGAIWPKWAQPSVKLRTQASTGVGPNPLHWSR